MVGEPDRVEQRGIHAAFSYGLGILRSDIGHFKE